MPGFAAAVLPMLNSLVPGGVTGLSEKPDVVPGGGAVAIGSGGPYAQAAARALLDNTDLDARTIVEKGLGIAGDICIYTNHNLTIEQLDF